jgi:fumarate hydratase subunit beta
MVARITCSPFVREEELAGLQAGDAVEISGELITMRDGTVAKLRAPGPPSVELAGRLLYAVGPSPAKPGQVIGSAGPTTTERLAGSFDLLFGRGARGIIGKGELHGASAEPFSRYGAVYLVAIGGLGALLAKRIVAADVVAFPELGPEAVYRLIVKDFPVVVAIDARGRNFHEIARARWRRMST